ncbi:hypothetical protein [Methylorubrum sp. GM97]|uniref:hypothetical protein n=1 Tax=Methylorubrum sp. GM97 TaxID=2938232 RepID=UPI0021866BED|nr:hypothetical protein [Methylorubrum sp. GM97]BDL40907.1 hypothetical protein MSPGM_34970 [Methylorubrum sp. GM97]
MADVGDFIRQRWPTVQLRISRLNERKRALEAQLAEVEAELEEAGTEFEALQNAANTLKLNTTLLAGPGNDTQEPFFRFYSFGDVSIKQAVRLTLDANRNGVSSHDLHAMINRRYFEDKLQRTSFSPQLSRLKQDGEVIDQGYGWILTDKGRAVMAEGKILPYTNSVFD